MEGTKIPGSGGERGSALLIVFVFAAVIAIMLYREMPVSLFEAQRQKEQLLIDRGHEYQRAVQLYYRKFHGQYPNNIEQLENTNSMRFLRHRYKDPMTGKDDWRLLHAGPGGMLIDSKVNPLKPGGQGPLGTGPQGGQGSLLGANQGATNGQSGSNTSAFGSSSNDSFGSPQSPSDSSGPDTGLSATARLPRRPPAIASSAGAAGSAGNSELDQDPSKPLLSATDSGSANGPVAGDPLQSQQPGSSGQPGAPGQPGINGQQPGVNAQQPGAAIISGLQSLAGNQRNGAFRSSLGTMTGGAGLAGVASNSKGSSIKVVNDQQDYSKWEFYYDPSKDTSMSGPGMGVAGMGGMQQQGNQTPGGLNNNNSGFSNNSQQGIQAGTATDNGAVNSGAAGGGQQPAPGQPVITNGPGPNQTSPNQ